MNTPKFLYKLYVGWGNKFLIPLSHDATSAAENEAAPITHKPLGLKYGIGMQK